MPDASVGSQRFPNRSDDQECAVERTPLTRCSQFREYMQADQQLNANYGVLMKKLTKRNADALRASQRAWLNWRLEKCEEVDRQANCDNGVCAGVAHDDCMVSLTRLRAAELKRFATEPARAGAAKFTFAQPPDVR